MRAADTYTEYLFTVKTLGNFIPQNHPLRPIRNMSNEPWAVSRVFIRACMPRNPKAAAWPTCDCSGETYIILGADKGYHAKEFIETLTDMKVTPHVAQNTSGRRSAVTGEIANTEGYSISQQGRKLIEQGFGWDKTIGNIRKVIVRGLQKVDQMFVLTMEAYNLTRMRSLGQLRPEAAQ